MGQLLCCASIEGTCVHGQTLSLDKNEIEMLRNIEDEKVMLFSLDKKIVTAKIVRVYDGDTCFAVFKLGNEFVKFKVRMEGYDSPEMKPPMEQANRDKEKKFAQKAKEELERLVLNKIVFLHCGKWDKYGRLLGKIISNNIDVNQHMIKNGFGYAYDGGTKKQYE
jgi:endonuclease YncB( thermonuclease family)